LCRAKGDWAFQRGLKTLSVGPVTIDAAKALIYEVPLTQRRLKVQLIATPDEGELCEAFLKRWLPGIVLELAALPWKG
jgi:hypothetical protein